MRYDLNTRLWFVLAAAVVVGSFAVSNMLASDMKACEKKYSRATCANLIWK